MGFTNAERQRCAAGVPVQELRPARTKPRPKRWAAAPPELRALQAEYEAWRDGLPESRTHELLEGVCDVDLGRARRRPAAGVRTRLKRHDAGRMLGIAGLVIAALRLLG